MHLILERSGAGIALSYAWNGKQWHNP